MVLLGLYVIHNKLSAGTFMPISGMTKSGIVLPQSLYVFFANLFPPLADLKNALVAKQSDVVSLSVNAFRGIQLLGPALFAGVYLAIVYKRHRSDVRYLLPAGLAGHITIKSLYNLVNVHLWHQGPWYYAFNILAISFLMAILLGPAWESVARLRVLRVAVPAMYLFHVVSLASAMAIKTTHFSDPAEHDLWRDRADIAAQLRKSGEASGEVSGEVKLLAFDDGITSFSLPFASLHGFGFASDLATFRALKQGRLLRHAFDRGHNVITSSAYMPVRQPLQDSNAVRSFLAASFLDASVKGELDDFEYELLLVHRPTAAPYIRFWPKSSR